MIFATDKGRMCNNILQYGHVMAWGLEHGRATVSMRFAYKYPYFKICRSPRHNIAFHLVGKWGAKTGLLPVADFDSVEDCGSLERRMKANRHCVVAGWGVRFYDLFAKHIAEIRDAFAFLPEVERGADKALAGCNGPKIGLHIRRGDYARWHGGRYFYTDGQYAAIARSALEMAGEDAVVVVCGNDPATDRSVFLKALGGRVRFACGNPGEDLCTLSRCQHLIGPPSTFTLVASMYRDTPLYWVSDPAAEVSTNSFGKFDTLFRNII